MCLRLRLIMLTTLVLVAGPLQPAPAVRAQATPIFLPAVLRGVPVLSIGNFADLATYATSPGTVVITGFLSGLTPYYTILRAAGSQPETAFGHDLLLRPYALMVADTGYEAPLLLTAQRDYRLVLQTRNTLAGAPLRMTDIGLANERCNAASATTFEQIKFARLSPGEQARHLYLDVTCKRVVNFTTREHHYVYRSVDSGLTWTEIVNAADPDDSLKSFWVSRADPGILFRIDSLSTSGWVSTDGGAIWTAFERPYTGFTTSPTADQTWYSWSETSGAVSLNGGTSWQTWSAQAACASGRHVQLVALQGPPETIAALCGPSGPLSMSPDRGQTWASVASLPEHQIEILFPDAGSPGTVLAFARLTIPLPAPENAGYGALIQASTADPRWLELARFSSSWP